MIKNMTIWIDGQKYKLVPVSSNSLSPEQVLEICETTLQIKISDLKGRRLPCIANKHIFMLMLRRYSILSLEAIAHKFGLKDHASTINAIQSMEARYQTDITIKNTIDKVENEILKHIQ